TALFSGDGLPRAPHSFPTRRSSDLDGAVGYDGRGRSLRHPVDEVATMAARIGGVRDDHGDTPADATLLGSAATLEETGLIGSPRSEEHTSELQSRENLVCRLLLEKK